MVLQADTRKDAWTEAQVRSTRSRQGLFSSVVVAASCQIIFQAHLGSSSTSQSFLGAVMDQVDEFHSGKKHKMSFNIWSEGAPQAWVRFSASQDFFLENVLGKRPKLILRQSNAEI